MERERLSTESCVCMQFTTRINDNAAPLIRMCGNDTLNRRNGRSESTRERVPHDSSERIIQKKKNKAVSYFVKTLKINIAILTNIGLNTTSCRKIELNT